MNTSLTKLLSLSSNDICSEPIDPSIASAYLKAWGNTGQELAEMLSTRNGFWAFESALLVRPFAHTGSPLGLCEWNEVTLWKDSYEFKLENALFFAEDLFGEQFAIVEDKIESFDPETGTFEHVTDSLEAWAAEMLKDTDSRTGYPLVRKWRLKGNSFSPGMRLVPRLPFVLGGEYDIKNLHAMNDVKGMRFRASIANQIKDLPDGSQVTIEFTEQASQQ